MQVGTDVAIVCPQYRKEPWPEDRVGHTGKILALVPHENMQGGAQVIFDDGMYSYYNLDWLQEI